MARVAITGATGFIGGVLLDSLLADGESVRVLVRKAGDVARFEERGIEVVQGDVGDSASLRQLCAGASVLFHLAASRSYWSGDMDRQVKLNVGGTRNVMSAAHATRVDRVVFTSSVAAIGVPSGDPASEDFEFNASWCPYHWSKWLSEQEAFS